MKTLLRLLAVPPLLYIGTVALLAFGPYLEYRVRQQLQNL